MTMRAWRFHEFGEIDQLLLEEIAIPAPREDEALVRVKYAALNPADRYMVAGQYPRPAPRPFSVGRDLCGEVVNPARESRFKVGDLVVLLRSDLGVSRTGSLAEFVAVPEESLAPLPKGWSAQEGAAGPLVLLTAWQALVDRGALQRGETVLITGASGGVGTAATLLAKGLGAKVVALSRSAEKRAALEAMGADITIDSGGERWDKETREALAGGRVDLVVENLGGAFLGRSLNLLGMNGRAMVVGLLSDLKAEIVLGLMIHKCLRIQGLSVSSYTAGESQGAWLGIVNTLSQSGVKPLIDRVFPLEEVPAAFERLAEGPLGKVVIEVSA